MSNRVMSATPQPSGPSPRRPTKARLSSIRTPRSKVNPAKSTAPTIPQCTNPECSESDVVEDDGKLICRSCGFIVQEVQITQELTFGETAAGAAVVQGVFVGAHDETARTGGAGMSRITGGMDSRQVTERNGLHHINSLAAALRLNTTHKERAMQTYRLAMNINFIQGRTTREVAAVCLYVACRRDPESKSMLIDFSDLLEINVFKLGQIYNTLVQELGLRTDNVGLYDMNPENLIQRFAQDLEFGPDEHRIANEAVQILRRMKRDWMHVGRRPSGVCGAALILAARMNNYRRTVREVVYTAKVCEITIHKRLEEFKFTESSQLSVAEFRHHGLSLEKDHDPPAFYQQFLKKKRRKVRHSGTAEEEMSDVGSQEEETTNMSNADRQAMPPPPIPIDPALLAVSAKRLAELGSDATDSTERAPDRGPDERSRDQLMESTGDPSVEEKRKRGRPKGSKNRPLPEKTKVAINDERQIESEIDSILNDPNAVSEASRLHENIGSIQTHGQEPNTPPSTIPTKQNTYEGVPAEGTTDVEEPFLSSNDEAGNEPDQGFGDKMSGPGASRDSQHEVPHRHSSQRHASRWVSSVLDSPTISESEFADDPDVENCVLTDAEIAIKERIWVNENGEYLRQQQARRIKAELAAAAGTARVIRRRRRRRNRMGDMSRYYTPTPTSDGGDGDGDSERGAFVGPGSAEEATRKMMEHRGYSRKINYERIEHLYAKSRGQKTTSEELGTSEALPNTATSSDGPRPVIATPSHVKAAREVDEAELGAPQDTRTRAQTNLKTYTSKETGRSTTAAIRPPLSAPLDTQIVASQEAYDDEEGDEDDYYQDDDDDIARPDAGEEEEEEEEMYDTGEGFD